MISADKRFTGRSITEATKESFRKESSLRNVDFSAPSKGLCGRKNVLLVGFEFYLGRISGDKNFWLGLSRELAPKLDKMVIVSVNSSPVKFQQEENIHLYNVQRPFRRNRDNRKGLRFQLQKHFLRWGILERSVTVLKLIPFLKKLVKLHNIQVIHLMDNFGFLTGLVKLFFPQLGVYGTTITYNTHSFPSKLYSFYQRLVFANLDKVIVSSDAYREKLIEHGLSSEKVKVIRWGVPILDGKRISPTKKEKKYPSNKVILWTGFTQQIKTKSFHLSLSLAKSIIAKKSSIDFIFAFKPECFDKRYERFQGEHLQVISTKHQDFQKLLERVNLLLAPFENSKSTVAPPLTWIECMNLGIPIMSTQAPGINEVLKHNITGFVAKSNEDLEILMENVLEDKNLLRGVSSKAREWVRENYSLKNITQDYLKLWRERW